MEVTEIRIKLAGNPADKLRAFCTVTFDNCFVVRDLKIINGSHGAFVAMPSRKLTDLCPRCRGKNHLRAPYCNECGAKLPPDRAERDEQGRAKLHADIAHPIHTEYREHLQSIVLEAFERELEQAGQPGYRPVEDTDTDDVDTQIMDTKDVDTDDHGDAEQPRRETAAPEAPPPEPPRQDERGNRFGEGILP